MHHLIRLILAGIFLITICRPSQAGESIPLAGEWRFALDRNDAGTNEKWFTKELPDKIQLPGILQAQGYGDDISPATPWVLGLGDAWWKTQPKELREHFSRPGHVEVPFLSQPPKHYLGTAWYQRDIDVPMDWKGRHFTLYLERAHWQSTAWMDEQPFPANDSLVAPHITDLGVLTPGKHRLTIRMDNRMQLPAAGHLVDSHSISDALGAAWNGIVGKIELRSDDPIRIERLELYPDLNRHGVTAHIFTRNDTGQEAQAPLLMLQVVPKSFGGNALKPLQQKATIPPGQTNLTLFFPLDDAAKEWSEFDPKFYQLRATIGGKDFHSEMAAGFGLREITTHDKDMLINGRPVNLRLTHFGGDFPLTGYPAMDIASWKKIIKACKDYGFNGIRFHSWCPPEAAFEAADEMGFYLQPECGLWADFGSPSMKQWLNDETARILAAYGNHPSFILLSPSNEPRNYSRFTPQWAATNYANDNRRLYSAGTGWADPSQVNGGAQYASLVRYGNGNLRNSTGWFGRDYGDALGDVHIPVLAHEVGQWCAYPDFDVMKKFTGYLQPGNYDIFKYIADQQRVLDEDHDFAWASGRFQVACYKEEIEANLRTPGLSGFQLLDLHDYLGQGTALIGVLDAFWESKGYVTPEEFRKFCGPVVPLARLSKRNFTSNETLESQVEIYNFGEKPVSGAATSWKITDTSGNPVASGQWDARDLPLGKNIPLGKISADLSKLPAPAQYKLVVTTGPEQLLKSELRDFPRYAQNDWNFWLYPAQVEDSKATDVLTTSVWADAEKKLAAGGKVLFIPYTADLDPTKCPPMRNVPVFWNIQMTVRPPQNSHARFDAMLGLLCETNHPALAEFPTDKNCDWQWTPLVNGVRSVNLSSAPHSLKPIVWAIDDWNRNWKLGVIFECNVGPGRLLVSAIDLNGDHGGPGLQQLGRSVLDYMGGDKFQPSATLTPAEAANLWNHGPASTNEPARVFDPDLNDGSGPARPKSNP